MPKKSKRSKNAHPDLNPSLNLKSRYDLYDQDYLDQLSPDELDWLNQFNKEYVSGSIDRENIDNNLHNDRKYVKDADDRNNSRNRCILTREKASHRLTNYEDLVDETTTNDYEDEIIEELDKAEARAAIEWLAKEINRDEEKLETRLLTEEQDTDKQ